RTIPTYIVYDNVTQCFGHELLSGAMRFSEEPNDRLHWLRTEGPGTFRLQGNVSGHCRLMGPQSLTCLEYFRTLGPDRFRIFSPRNSLTVTDFGGIYRRPHVHSGIRWPQVLFQKQVIAKSLFLDLLTREAGKASHMTVNLSKEPLFEGQTGLSPQNP